MDRATVSRIEDWESRPVTGGYAGLHELADAGFTGAVAAGGAHLFMLNGRAVGIVDGSISTFERAEATAYEAPHPSLPLLFAMQAREGEVRGQYYTDDTPIDEVDQTLTEGGFTGYLELSENVLSGDYYVVYYGGRSLSAAFIGNEGRVETGDEAFRLAADEVGIYEVRSVDLDVIDVPEPAGLAGGAAAVDETAPESDPDEEPDGDEAPPEEADAEADVQDEDAEEDEEAVAGADGSADDADDADDADEADDLPPDGAEEPEEPPTPDEPTTAGVGPPGEEPLVEDAESGGAVGPAETAGTAETGGMAPEGAGAADPDARADADADAGGGEPEERFREEARWRETRTVPALDPEESETPDGGSEPARPPNEGGSPGRDAVAADRARPNPADVEAFRQRVEQLEAELEARERERRRLAEHVEELTDERDSLYGEREELERRIDRLEGRIEAAADAGDGASGSTGASAVPAGEAMDAESALDQTDLFVRYGSKGEATLQRAHDGQAGREDVAGNLRLETHCRFDAEGVTVDGRAFEEFLQSTIEYRFVAWLIEDLLYEIRQTGSERALRQLFDALPKIDRAEFHGVVTSRDDQGEEREETFDVVCRNRMGQPLLVANINDSLDPATGDMMGGLIEDATAAGETAETMAAAFLVTASFFEPNALETASEATGGGFLSRDSKKSFVKLSRKGGYHLCLVEARGDDFHVAVPEL